LCGTGCALGPREPFAASGHPIAFFSRPIAPRHHALAAYERELIGLVQAVRHWRPYLWDRRFIVKTDHYSLKYLLDQRLATIPQHHWVGKLLGFDFTVEYRSGATNTLVDALSRRDTDTAGLMAISAPRFDFIARLRQAQATDPSLVAILDEIRAGIRATIRSYEPGDTRVAAIALDMEARVSFLADVRYRLHQAQEVQKRHYDRLHRQVTYQVGEWVLLRLRQHQAASLPRTTTGKLKPRYVGPYRIVELVNSVAVRLELPPGARLHDVFHIGVIKKFVGTPLATPPALPTILHGAVLPESDRVVNARLARDVRQLLVHWRGKPATSATWEDFDDFRTRYPDFHLEEGRHVMCVRTYTRRRRARDIRRAAERAARAGTARQSGLVALLGA
jgi:hypothetical protein